jgi:hypothetical protein
MAELKSIAASIDPREPYRAAWKEFDALEEWAVEKWFYYLALGLLAAVTRDILRSDPKLAYASWGVAIGAALISALIERRGRSRLEHWPCPQCHSEWPGKKGKKEPVCATCGLRLHQTSP